MTRTTFPVPLTTKPASTAEVLDPVALRRLVAELGLVLSESRRRTEVLETRTVIRDGIAKPPNTVGQMAVNGSDVYFATGLDVANWIKLTGAADGDKGDITVSSGGTAWTIDNNAITFAKMQDIATSTIMGRVTAATGDPEALTGTQATTLLDVFTSTLKGVAPASGGGTITFLRADGTWAAPPLTDLTDVTIATATQGQVLARGATEFQNLTLITLTLGPYFANDVAATVTTQMGQMYFDFSTTVKREGAIEVRMDRAGRIVGCILTSDAARTTGTATFRPRINGVGTDFAAGAVQINGTTTTGDSAFVAYANGIAFAAGATIGAEVVTVGWAPTTANMNAKIIVMLEPF